MKRLYAGLAVAAVAMSGGPALIEPAHAVPPTVTPSPGYDARLQEQRAASRLAVPTDPVIRPVYRRHHVRRAHYYR